MTFLEMMVDMDCVGCKKKIRKALEKLKGIDDIDINMELQKVTVLGWADPNKVLKAVRKTGRRAELWPYRQHFSDQDPYHQRQQYYYSDYQNQPIISCRASQASFLSSSYGLTVIDEQMSSLFSDDNPNACSIM